MAAGMMNGEAFQPNEASVSLPWILIAKVASRLLRIQVVSTL